MSITFNSTGGFLNGTISSSNGDLFIITSGSAGKITLGNTEYTGSEVIEKDSTGKVRNKKIFNTDGTITQQKFDQNEKITETKIKNPTSGKELVQSASANSNRIEFQQNIVGALIITSGSNPGFTAFMNDVGDRAMRARGDTYSSASALCSTGVAMNGSSLDYYIQMQHLGALGTTHTFGDSNGTGFLMVSQSGDTRVSKNLIVDGGISAASLNVTNFTSSFVTSSTIITEGNTLFGDTDSDSHTFNGNITASGNISASGTSHIFNGTIKPDAIDVNTAGNSGYTAIFRNDDGGTNLSVNVAGGVIVGGLVTQNAKLNVNGNMSTNSHITTSGNFSGSSTSTINVGGNITTNDSFLGQKLILGTIDNSDNAYISASDGNVKISGDGGNAGDVSLTIQNSDTSTATTQTTTLQFQQFSNQNAGKIVAGKEGIFAFHASTADSNLQFYTAIDGTDTERMRITSAGLVGIGNSSPTKTLTVEGDISASGDIFAHSGSFTYITASIVDVDGDTIRFGGEPFTKANIQTLKLGRSLKPPRAGRSKPDIDGDDGVFDGNITASGNIKAGGNLELTASSAGDLLKTKFVQMTNSSSVIDTFNTASFRSVKYVLQVTSASNYQVSEMLVLHHNSTASNTEYAQINSGLNLINFSTDVNNSNVRLNANGSFISCSVRYDRTIIPI